MYSYPNFIPLAAATVRKVVAPLDSLGYDRIYGAFWDMIIDHDAKDVVHRSAERYIRNLETGS